MKGKCPQGIAEVVDRYFEAAKVYQFERLFGPVDLPLTEAEREMVRKAEKTIMKAMWDIERTLEDLDPLPTFATGAVARAVLHEAYVIAGFRSGLPLVRRTGRESIHEVVNRFCYRPRRKT